MAYLLTGQATIGWGGDGAGPMGVLSAQSLRVIVPPALVPGGDTPSAANITTALNTMAASFAALLETTANLGIIQGWASGSP